MKLSLVIVRITSARTANGFHEGTECRVDPVSGIACAESGGGPVKAICLSDRRLRKGELAVGGVAGSDQRLSTRDCCGVNHASWVRETSRIDRTGDDTPRRMTHPGCRFKPGAMLHDWRFPMPTDRKLLVLLIVVLILMAVFCLPVFPYAAGFTVYPSAFAFVLALVLILMVAGGRL